MDADVVAAMARWPNVPAVHGWLSLTARGHWRLRGEPIGNRAIVEFIERNYACDERGRWFFQNGPQRVFVALELTPWVFRVEHGGLRSHTGSVPRECRAALLLDDGRVALDTDLGVGVIDDRDAAALPRALADETGARLDEARLDEWLGGRREAWLLPGALGLAGGARPVERIGAAALAARFGFVPGPAAD